MGFAAVLDEILGQKSKLRILRLLLRSHGQLTGRDISRQSGLTHRTCHAALRDLARHGIVVRKKAGSAHLYELNEDHVLVKGALSTLFAAERNLIDAYSVAAREGLGIPVVSVILYGSVARGSERPESDVDLMFIVRNPKLADQAREKLGVLAASLYHRFGRVPQIVFADPKTFRTQVKERNPYYTAVVGDGQVLYGRPMAELLRNGS
jgi:predicted nucleotidyltransferase